MKKKESIWVLLLVAILMIKIGDRVYGQENEIYNSECPNYNAFAKSSQVELIKPFVGEILPNGTFYTDPNNAQNYEQIFQMLNMDNFTTFEFISETQSQLNETKYFRKYQQYYKNIKVVGGGYVAAYQYPGGPTGPTGPCDGAYMIVPHILTGIEFNVTPNIASSQLGLMLNAEEIFEKELEITHNLTDQCEFRLVWRVEYVTDQPKVSWIDAKTGVIVKTLNTTLGIKAPTVTYGEQLLNDKKIGNTTYLQSPDNRIKVYENIDYCPDFTYYPFQWTTNKIPLTSNLIEWSNEASKEAYQAFWVTSKVVPLLNTIGIKFNKVNVGVCHEENSTYALKNKPPDQAFILLANIDSKTASLYDIVAHELMHEYLIKFLDDNNTKTNRTLHEGISDVIGTYIESLIPDNNGIDWIIGDDEQMVGNKINRNLQFPKYKCATDVYANDAYIRGLIVGHWYYNVTQGNQKNEIPALGMQKGVNILLSALPLLETQDGLLELMQATLTIALDEYGRCSDEFIACARAWELVCVPTSYEVNGFEFIPSCKFELDGPTTICEEEDAAQFCAHGGLPDYQYQFRIIGGKSAEYQSVCGMEGNTQYGCDCLTLTDFPKYPYYPQYLTIELYSPKAGPQFTQKKKIKLIDCSGDDPSCDEYYNQIGQHNENRSIENIQKLDVQANQKVKYLKCFDLLGRLLWEGDYSQFSAEKIHFKGIGIIMYFDQFGLIIQAKKITLSDQ